MFGIPINGDNVKINKNREPVKSTDSTKEVVTLVLYFYCGFDKQVFVYQIQHWQIEYVKQNWEIGGEK